MGAVLLRLPLAVVLPRQAYVVIAQLLTYASRLTPVAWHIGRFSSPLTAHSRWYLRSFHPWLDLFQYFTVPEPVAAVEALIGLLNFTGLAVLSYSYGRRYPDLNLNMLTLLPAQALVLAACVCLAYSLRRRPLRTAAGMAPLPPAPHGGGVATATKRSAVAPALADGAQARAAPAARARGHRHTAVAAATAQGQAEPLARRAGAWLRRRWAQLRGGVRVAGLGGPRGTSAAADADTDRNCKDGAIGAPAQPTDALYRGEEAGAEMAAIATVTAPAVVPASVSPCCAAGPGGASQPGQQQQQQLLLRPSYLPFDPTASRVTCVHVGECGEPAAPLPAQAQASASAAAAAAPGAACAPRQAEHPQAFCAAALRLGGQADAAAAAAAALRPAGWRPQRVLPPYRPFIRRSCTFAKVHGFEPTQISPGFEQRIALLFASLEGNEDGRRRLGAAYVRAGCIELLLEEEDWGPLWGSGSNSAEVGEWAADAPAGGNGGGGAWPAWDPATGRHAAVGVLMAGAVGGVGADAYKYVPTSGEGGAVRPGGTGTFSARSGDGSGWAGGDGSGAAAGSGGERGCISLVAIMQALQLQLPDEGGATGSAVTESLAAAEAAEADRESELGAEVGFGGADGLAATATAAGAAAMSEADAEAATMAPASASAVAEAEPGGTGSSSRRNLELARAEGGFRQGAAPSGSTIVGDFGAEGPTGAPSPPAPTPAPPAHAQPQPRPQAQAAQGAAPPPVAWLGEPGNASATPPHHPHPPPPPCFTVTVHPRVLLLPSPAAPAAAGSTHAVPNAAAQPPGPQQLQRGGYDSAAAPSAGPGGDGGGAAADATTGSPAATLHITVQRFATAATAGRSAPIWSNLEVLVRARGAYLPARVRWLPALAATGAGGDGAAAGERLGGAAPGAMAAMEEEGVCGADLVDQDVDRSRAALAAVELLALPPQPGVLLVDLRWRGVPCNTAPLLLTADPRVAAELGAAATAWPRSASELSELIFDIGVWELHTSGLGAPPPGAAAAGAGSSPPQPPLMCPPPLLPALGQHLLSYSLACGWRGVAARLARDLARLSEEQRRGREAAAASPPPPAAAQTQAATAAPPPPVAPWRATEADGAVPAAEPAAVAAAKPGPGPGSAPSGVATLRAATCYGSGAGGAGSSAHGGAGGGSSGIPGSSASAARPLPGQLRWSWRPPPRPPASQSRGGGGGAGGWVRMLQLVLGLVRAPPSEEEAFRTYASEWVFAQGLAIRIFDCVGLVAMLYRCAREGRLLSIASLPLLLVFGTGAASSAARLVLRPAAWAALERRSALPRYGGYALGKVLIAFGGVPLPPGVAAYLRMPGLLLLQGLIVPGSCLLPPRAALLVIPAINLLTLFELLATGSELSAAVLVSVRTAVVGLTTNIACHAYMRLCFEQRRDELVAPTGGGGGGGGLALGCAGEGASGGAKCGKAA